MDDAQIEQQIQDKGLTAPRVTIDDINDNIVSEYYFTAAEGALGSGSAVCNDDGIPLSLLTFCVLVLNNGFTVTGVSACVSPANFDAQLGKDIARKDATNTMWSLLGYALKQKLYDEAEFSRPVAEDF
jgi:hypothetical protein